MRIRTTTMPVLILIVFWGIIGLSIATGIWQTQVSAADIEVTTADDIKGWMSVAEISEYLSIPANQLIKTLALPADIDRNRPLKEIAEENGTTADQLKDVLAEHHEQKVLHPSE